MKMFSLLLLVIPFSLLGQEVDIYGKWTALLDHKTQVILDVSNRNTISVMRIRIDEQEKYRVDSFGFKRTCYANFKDLDSSRIFWTAQMESIHPTIIEDVAVGEFIISERNRNNTPIRMKLTNELPDLAISFSESDTIEFTRMVTRDNEDEIHRSYLTFYGGRVEETIYYGEHSGYSGGMSGFGMRYSKIKINPTFKQQFLHKMTAAVNKVRKQQEADSLVRHQELDDESETDLNNWINGMMKSHQVKTKDDEYWGTVDNINSNFKLNEFEFQLHPFQCGKNMLLMVLPQQFIHSKKIFQQYLLKNLDLLVEHAMAAMLHTKGAKQNVVNNGYATIGVDVQLVEGSADDFYFTENGERIFIRDKKNPYYYLMVSQRFSINQ